MPTEQNRNFHLRKGTKLSVKGIVACVVRTLFSSERELPRAERQVAFPDRILPPSG